MFTAGVALLLSMGNLFYRDVKYLFEIVFSVWMFATSVVYPVDRVGGWLGPLLGLNPMTPIIDAYRASSCSGTLPPAGLLLAPAWSRCALLIVALGSVSTAPNSSSRRTSDVEPPVVFDSVWKKFRRGERHDSLRDLIPALVRRAHPAAARRRELARREFWALQDVSFEVRPRRGARHHRPERRRQVDDAEAADADPEADARAAARCAAASAR